MFKKGSDTIKCVRCLKKIKRYTTFKGYCIECLKEITSLIIDLNEEIKNKQGAPKKEIKVTVQGAFCHCGECIPLILECPECDMQIELSDIFVDLFCNRCSTIKETFKPRTDPETVLDDIDMDVRDEEDEEQSF